MKATKLCRFNRETSHFSAFRELSSLVVCWWLWNEPVCWWWEEGAELEIDRATAGARNDLHICTIMSADGLI